MLLSRGELGVDRERSSRKDQAMPRGRRSQRIKRSRVRAVILGAEKNPLWRKGGRKGGGIISNPVVVAIVNRWEIENER